MNHFGDFHFLRPAWLLLLPVAVAIWWYVRRAEDPLRGWRRVIDRELLSELTAGRNAKDRWMGIGLLTCWVLLILAISGPTWKPEPSPFADDPVPVMIVLKAGETMDLTDLTPSRMERAQLKVADFAEQRKGLPLGLIAFAGSAHLVLPPTRDTSVVATMAGEISAEIMPSSGDDLVAALRLAAKTLGPHGGSIVVMTDTIAEGNKEQLSRFRTDHKLPVYILAITRPDTPEWDNIKQAAQTLTADVTAISPDSEDIRSLVRNTAEAPVAVEATGEGTRWSEAGWWLVPLIALLALLPFRRVNREKIEEVAS